MSVYPTLPSASLRDKLIFPRSFLVLLKETELFGPLLEKAIDDIDAAMEEVEQKGL